jgi:hypothetical protein
MCFREHSGCPTGDLISALSSAPVANLTGLEILEMRSTWSQGSRDGRIKPAPARLFCSMPKLLYLYLPTFWQLTEELVELMAERMPRLCAFAVSRELTAT